VAPARGEELDESLIVRTAAKREVTVQESAAIVAVVTRDQILVRGYRIVARASAC
jgi:hypothetical protein